MTTPGPPRPMLTMGNGVVPLLRNQKLNVLLVFKTCWPNANDIGVTLKAKLAAVEPRSCTYTS